MQRTNIMSTPAQLSPRVAALLKKTQASRGRLIFAVDATASRERTWDMAASLQAAMFEEAARIGGLDVQLVHFGGDQILHSPWLSDAHELVNLMRGIRCMSGATQIGKVLQHVRAENQREKIGAAIFIGDAMEESPGELYDAAATLGVPLFMFQEGDGPAFYLDQHGTPVDQKVEQIFRKVARLSGGAYGKFDAGAAKQLGELLRAVAAFAVGGAAALANQHTDSARKLLGQMK
jgi:von Willebrand factor type A domain